MTTRGVYDLVSEGELRKYAALAVRTGVNVQKNQLVIIHSDVQNAVFARHIQAEAYTAGASNVAMDWSDELSTRQYFLHASDDAINSYPDWKRAQFQEWDDAGAAYIRIISENPDVFQDVPTERISRSQTASRAKLHTHSAKTRSYRARWSVLAVPSFPWAAQVYPHLSHDEAIQTLWEAILQGARADGRSPLRDWADHDRTLELRKQFLNASQFRSLRFTNSQGTDLHVGLPKDHSFIGGHVLDDNGIPFFPNIPTEEIFSAPHKYEVRGRVVASKPLVYDGSIIDDLHLTFEDGRIVDFSTTSSMQALRGIIDTDAGSHYLGEIALVPHDSPLSHRGVLYYNTLFDENTACHLGIGNASPATLRDGGNLSPSQLQEAGLNSSLLLVNVTFGTGDMRVVGIKENGTEMLLLDHGKFQF